MTLPKDPAILLSFINMKLRDNNYESLSDACLSLGIDEHELVERLKAAGFDYLPAQKQFR